MSPLSLDEWVLLPTVQHLFKFNQNEAENFHSIMSLDDPLLQPQAMDIIKTKIRNLPLFSGYESGINSSFTIPVVFDLWLNPCKFAELKKETILLNITRAILQQPRSTRLDFIIDNISKLQCISPDNNNVNNVFSVSMMLTYLNVIKNSTKYEILDGISHSFINDFSSLMSHPQILTTEINKYQQVFNRTVLSYWLYESFWTLENYREIELLTQEKNTELFSALFCKK